MSKTPKHMRARRTLGTHHAKVEAIQALANHARVDATGAVPQPLFVQMGLAQGITPQAFGVVIPLPLVSILDAEDNAQHGGGGYVSVTHGA